MEKVVTTVDKAKFIGIELSKEVVGTAGGFGGVWLGEKLGLSQDKSMLLGMITSIVSSKGADWVDNNFDNLIFAGKYTFNNYGKNVTLSMNGSGTLNEFCDSFKKIKNGEIIFNSIDDVIKLGINSVDDLMKLGVNSVDDLAKLKVSSIDDLAKIGIKNADDLAKLGIDSSDLKKLGIDSKVFEGVSNPNSKEIISERVNGLDLSNHTLTNKQLSSKKMKEIKSKIDNRTATKAEYEAYEWNEKFSARRREGVKQFWNQERERIINGESTTRNWTTEQIQDILNGKTPKYDGKPIQGHHSYSASKYPHLADKGEIIYPVTPNEHLKGWHGGNFKNSSPGEPIIDINDF